MLFGWAVFVERLGPNVWFNDFQINWLFVNKCINSNYLYSPSKRSSTRFHCKLLHLVWKSTISFSALKWILRMEIGKQHETFLPFANISTQTKRNYQWPDAESLACSAANLHWVHQLVWLECDLNSPNDCLRGQQRSYAKYGSNRSHRPYDYNHNYTLLIHKFSTQMVIELVPWNCWWVSRTRVYRHICSQIRTYFKGFY